MMGNAAIQAAERARDLVAVGRGGAPRGARSRRLVFADRRVFDTEDPERGVDLPAKRCASPRRKPRHGGHRRVVHSPAPRRRASRAAASVRHLPIRIPRPWSRSTSIPPPAGSRRADECGSPTTSGARSTPRSSAARWRAGVYMALGEALMEEQTFRRLPDKLSHALVHKFPSMLEYKSPTTHDMPEVDHRARWRIRIPTDRSAPRKSDRDRCFRSCRRWCNAIHDAVGVRDRRGSGRRPDKVLKALDNKAKGGRGTLRTVDAFPEIRLAGPAGSFPPPWDGGDGKRRQRARKRPGSETAR